MNLTDQVVSRQKTNMTDTTKRTNEEIAEDSLYWETGKSVCHIQTKALFIEALNTKDAEHAKELAAYGGCNNCFGKGYSTVLDYSVGRGEYDMGQGGVVINRQNPIMRYCSCGRGSQLKELIEKDKEEAVAEAVREEMERIKKLVDDTGEPYIYVPDLEKIILQK